MTDVPTEEKYWQTYATNGVCGREIQMNRGGANTEVWNFFFSSEIVGNPSLKLYKTATIEASSQSL